MTDPTARQRYLQLALFACIHLSFRLHDDIPVADVEPRHGILPEARSNGFGVGQSGGARFATLKARIEVEYLCKPPIEVAKGSHVLGCAYEGRRFSKGHVLSLSRIGCGHGEPAHHG